MDRDERSVGIRTDIKITRYPRTRELYVRYGNGKPATVVELVEMLDRLSAVACDMSKELEEVSDKISCKTADKLLSRYSVIEADISSFFDLG